MTWIDAVIAAPILTLIAALLWRTAEALRRRGVVVRPVSMMDALMSKVEKQFAGKPRGARADVPPVEDNREDRRDA